ncbi:MAG: peptide ABC transporter substrate-binding protein [Clostridia bacterium]|nr:peptide ABC transporter substrate-binding protein [Clostridia bacterium]
MKKVLCLMLVFVMLVGTLASCGSDLKGDEKGAMITMCVSTLPDTFDPSAYAIDADVNKIFSLIYMPLTTLDSEGELGQGLAESWGYFYDDIYLEDKMYFDMYESCWSDGRPVTADDFVYAWKRILSPASQSPYASLLYGIKNAKAVKEGTMTSDDLGIVAVDDTRIEITFKDGYVKDNGSEVAAQFAETVANVAFAPLREDRIETTDNWTTIVSVANVLCNGPFYVRSYGYEADVRAIELERNKYYRRDDEEGDALDKYVSPFKLICEYDTENGQLETEAAKYDRGDSFYLGEFTPDTYSSYGSKLTSTDSLSSHVYYFNTENELFKDARVRKALSMAIDRTEIAKIVGCGSTASTGFVPNGVFNTKKGTSFRTESGELYSTSAQFDEAKALLKEAGVTRGKFTINFAKEAESEVNELVAEYVKGVWEELGFTVTVKGINVHLTSQAIRNAMYGSTAVVDENGAETGSVANFDVLAVDLSMSSTNPLVYLAQFAAGYSGNYVDINVDGSVDTHFTRYNNAEYNELVEKIDAESDRGERAKLLHELEAKLVEECPAFAVVDYKNSYVASSDLDEYSHYYNGAPNFMELELDDWRDVNAKLEAEEEEQQAQAAASTDAE